MIWGGAPKQKTHTHTDARTYFVLCVCVCVCVKLQSCGVALVFFVCWSPAFLFNDHLAELRLGSSSHHSALAAERRWPPVSARPIASRSRLTCRLFEFSSGGIKIRLSPLRWTLALREHGLIPNIGLAVFGLWIALNFIAFLLLCYYGGLPIIMEKATTPFVFSTFPSSRDLSITGIPLSS